MLFHVRHTITLFFETFLDITKFYQHIEYVKRLQLLQRDQQMRTLHSNFEVRHPRCVSTKSNYKVYAYIFQHNYI
jgi:hypothetical protein